MEGAALGVSKGWASKAATPRATPKRVTALHLRGRYSDAIRQERAEGDGVAVELGAVDRHGAGEVRAL